MRQFIKSVLLLGLLSLTSCDGLLDQIPEIAVTSENVWTSEYDAQKVFNSMHFDFRATLSTNINWLQSELRAREFSSCSDYTRQHIFNNTPYLMTAQGDVSWSSYYNVIAMANLLIDNVHKVPMSNERKSYIKGSALFIRAFCYFFILKTWGEAPVILSLDNMNVGRKSDRAALAARVITDALAAENALRGMEWSDLTTSLIGMPEKTKQMVSIGAVHALLAHVYAWQGSLTGDREMMNESVKFATLVIENKEYALANHPEEVCMSVMKGNSPEGIFEAAFNSSEQNGTATPGFHLTTYPVVDNMGPLDMISKWPYNQWVINNNLVESIYDEPGDKRLNSYFYDYERMKSMYAALNNNRPYFQKWRHPAYSKDANHAMQGFECNVVFFRLADIILLRAEINNRLGHTGPAILDLDWIRGRAGLGGYSAAVNGDLKLAILKERRRELFMEGHRFFDLLRNGEVRNQVESFRGMTDMDVEDGCYYLPVPAGAFTKNPAMRQNLYWKRNGY